MEGGARCTSGRMGGCGMTEFDAVWVGDQGRPLSVGHGGCRVQVQKH